MTLEDPIHTEIAFYLDALAVHYNVPMHHQQFGDVACALMAYLLDGKICKVWRDAKGRFRLDVYDENLKGSL